MNLGQSVFIEAKDDGSGGVYCSYKSYKAPVRLSSPTNQHPLFYRLDALPVVKALKGKISHSMDFLTPNSLGGLPTQVDLSRVKPCSCSRWHQFNQLSFLSKAQNWLLAVVKAIL